MNIKKLLLTATASLLTVSSIIGCGAKVPTRTSCKVGNYIYLRLDSIDFARGTANFVPA